MREWKEQAIILRIGHFRETDLWIKALLAKQGLCTLFAFGGAKSKKRFCGCLDIFNTISCRIRVSRTGEFFNLQEAELLEAPRMLRQDWRGMGMAMNCLLFTEAVGIGPESAPGCFNLLEDLRQAFEANGGRYPMYPIFFRMRMAAALGFAPDFQKCGRCGIPVNGEGYFFINDGALRCPACVAKTDFVSSWNIRRLDFFSLEFLRHIQKEMPTGWNSDQFLKADARKCCQAIDGFVQYHIGLMWDKGSFHRV